MSLDADLATLREALNGYAVRDFVEDHAAMDRVEAEIARLIQERDHAVALASEDNTELLLAREDLARLREGLRRGINVASQYLDTGRGDLDGWIDAARALLARLDGKETV